MQLPIIKNKIRVEIIFHVKQIGRSEGKSAPDPHAARCARRRRRIPSASAAPRSHRRAPDTRAPPEPRPPPSRLPLASPSYAFISFSNFLIKVDQKKETKKFSKQNAFRQVLMTVMALYNETQFQNLPVFRSLEYLTFSYCVNELMLKKKKKKDICPWIHGCFQKYMLDATF